MKFTFVDSVRCTLGERMDHAKRAGKVIAYIELTGEELDQLLRDTGPCQHDPLNNDDIREGGRSPLSKAAAQFRGIDVYIEGTI